MTAPELADRHEVVLARHGETAWSASGRHTGRTDVELTDAGRAAARALGPRLAVRAFAEVWTSPLARARETARLAGFASARDEPLVVEWDYGAVEGRTTAEMRAESPGWSVWEHGTPGGETLEELGARADRAIAKLRAARGDVLVFSHAHVLRVLAARWIALPPGAGARLALGTASLSVLGWERETAVIRAWNESAG